MNIIAESLNRALQKKVGQLYDNLFSALAIAADDQDQAREAEQAFQRGLALAKHCHQTALQLSDT